MPCPTCDHTMQNIGIRDTRVFWCPRCGTLKYELGPGEPLALTDDVPSLVKRCQDFSTLLKTSDLLQPWITLGISESIWPHSQ